MKYLVSIIGVLMVGFLLIGCGSEEKEDEEPLTEKDDTSEEVSSADDKYPLPILEGWEEIEIKFETIGNGTIDVWHGEFSYTKEIDDYFEPYQAALVESGFDIEVTQNAEGVKKLEFTKEIDGDKHVGNVLFTQNWVKSSLQHMK